jgi:hypothetical protein
MESTIGRICAINANQKGSNKYLIFAVVTRCRASELAIMIVIPNKKQHQ